MREGAEQRSATGRTSAGSEPASARGIRASVGRVVAHASSLARLEKELARVELERKAGTVGAGVGLVVAIGVMGIYAVGVALALFTAVLALMVDWWLALLIVFLVLLLVIVVLGFVARTLFRAGKPFKPEQALAEARATSQAIRGARAE